MTSSQSTSPIPCPACGAPASGRYCSECGAVVRGATCAACRSELAPGARFCHYCGAPVGAAAAAAGAPSGRPPSAVVAAQGPAQRNMLPWAIGGLAFVVLVVIVAAQRASDAPVAPSMGAAPMGAPGAAPDISAMTPRERADRLFDRIMRLDGEGKRDSVATFAPMALGAYEALGELDLDLRYDYGRVAEVAGNLDLAAAQADTILRQDPNHLLGLVLSMRVAERRGDTARRDQFARRLLAAQESELARGLREYQLHENDITAAITAAGGKR